MKLLKHIITLIILTTFLISCSGAKSTSTTKDGSSVKNAIKVKSVPEEYQIVKKLCSNCTFNGQSLISEDNKHYDVLSLTNEKGEVVKYYFDINSFFGKW